MSLRLAERLGDKVSPIEDPQTGIHHIRIELMAAHLDDLLPGLGNAEGGAMGAVGAVLLAAMTGRLNMPVITQALASTTGRRTGPY